jgi:hypothetical protein
MGKRFLFVLLLLAGCRGDLLATAKLTGPGTAEARFTAGKAVEFWASFDGKWEGRSLSKYSKPPLAYQIEAVQEGNVVASFKCDTLSSSSTRVCGGFTKWGSDFSGDCEFKMECQMPEVRAGEVLLRVTARLPDPSKIKELKDMSLNVRAQ